MFRFFGGVPRLLVPDNLKSGVNKASFYDPEINRTYGMMAAHDGVGVLPARPKRPKDNGMAEAFVKTFKRDYVAVNPTRMPKPSWRSSITIIFTRTAP